MISNDSHFGNRELGLLLISKCTLLRESDWISLDDKMVSCKHWPLFNALFS